MTVDNDDHFVLCHPAGFRGAVNLRVPLIAAASIVPDHFDRHVQLIFPARHHATPSFPGRVHVASVHKHGDAGFNRIFQRGIRSEWVYKTLRATATAVNRHSSDRQH